jgi:glutathionylspermidine synthase
MTDTTDTTDTPTTPGPTPDLGDPAYGAFAARLIDGGVLVDPWYEGVPRFAQQPLVLSRATWAEAQGVAERVAMVWAEVARICAEHPEHLDDFFALTPFQKVMWVASAPAWHGFARADLFQTPSGMVCCELNCDTPTGQPEAVLLNAAVAAERPDAVDPNVRLPGKLVALLETLGRRILGEGFARTVGLVYPTELTEDLPLVRAWQQWLEARGWTVVLGSPFNLTLGEDGTPALFGTPCPVILRHYKTDWWGEREPVFTDEAPFEDAAPLKAQLGVLLDGIVENRCVVVNPFGAVVPQNKKAMAFMWEHLDLLSVTAQATVRQHVPYTVRLEALHREQVVAERADWVLKSDYGCEGGEVLIGRRLTPEQWAEALELAAEGRWVAQRYFEAEEDAAGETLNLGVYLVGGEAAGLYCRAQAGATDARARSVPCLVAREDA